MFGGVWAAGGQSLKRQWRQLSRLVLLLLMRRQKRKTRLHWHVLDLHLACPCSVERCSCLRQIGVAERASKVLRYPSAAAVHRAQDLLQPLSSVLWPPWPLALRPWRTPLPGPPCPVLALIRTCCACTCTNQGRSVLFRLRQSTSISSDLTPTQVNVLPHNRVGSGGVVGLPSVPVDGPPCLLARVQQMMSDRRC